MNKTQHIPKKFSHAITRAEAKPLWWKGLPKRTRDEFKKQIDIAIKQFESQPPDKPCTVTLTRRRQNIICVAALNATGWDLAYKMAVVSAEQVGVTVDVIAITPGNYASWWA